MSTLQFRIVLPDGEYYSGTVDHVSLNTPSGRMGFLGGALPRVSVISAGVIEYTVNGEKTALVCGDGIMSIDATGITVATDECYRYGEEPNVAQHSVRRVDNNYKYAKARIAASILRMNEKQFPEETF